MSDGGLITITFSINKDKKMLYPTKVVTRGFMDPALAGNFNDTIKQKAKLKSFYLIRMFIKTLM